MRGFNEDIEIGDLYEEADDKYNHLFHIGISTTAGRLTTCCERLIQSLLAVTIDKNITISVICNTKHNWEKIPDYWPNVTVTDELKPISWMRNQHTMKSDRPYIIWFDDDSIVAHPQVIQQLAFAHVNTGFDVIRGFVNNCCISAHKSVLSEIGWWEERYVSWGEDTEWHMRLEKLRYKQNLEHNKARITDGLIVNHRHSPICNFDDSKVNWPTLHKEKWGLEQIQPENDEHMRSLVRGLEEIDFYPGYLEKFKHMEKIS